MQPRRLRASGSRSGSSTWTIPRVELEEHYYNAKHTKLLELGLQPHLLSETLIESMFDVIERYKDRVIPDHILPATRWRGVRERSSG